MSVTERMAEFIVETKWADFPALVIERAKKAVVDTVGVNTRSARVNPWDASWPISRKRWAARPRRPSSA